MLKATEGYYLLQTESGERYGAYSNNVHQDWNSHLFLKSKGKHPLGNKWKLQYLGDKRVAFEDFDFKLPKSPINYVRYCENCGKIYVPFVQRQRFDTKECRVYSYLKQERHDKRIGILQEYNYKCANGKDCPLYGKGRRLKVLWKERKPYCYKCFYVIWRKIISNSL